MKRNQKKRAQLALCAKKVDKPIKNSGIWIAPIIFAVLTATITVIGTLKGQWDTWWVKFIILPGLILTGSIGAYELFKFKFGCSRKSSRAVGASVFVLAMLAILFLYIHYSPYWEPPELPSGCDRVYIALGNGMMLGEHVSEMSKPTNRPVMIAVESGVQPITPYVRDNRFYVDFDIPIYESRFEGTIKIRDFKIGTIPPEWDANYNSNALEIVNSRNVPLCQIYYKSPNQIAIFGIFKFGNWCEAWGKNGVLPFNSNTPPEALGLKPLFKYPANLHRGELAD